MQKIMVEGKSLYDIAKDNHVKVGTIRARYTKGARTLEALSIPLKRTEYVKQLSNSGTVLLNIMYEQNMTISELSRETGITRATLYGYLYNSTDISAERLKRLCIALDVSMDYVMGLTERKA